MEGWWLSPKGKEIPIVEHSQWAVADREELPIRVMKDLESLNPQCDRIKILEAVMDAGYIRIRDHCTYISFEFKLDSSRALELIYNFAKDKLSNYSNMYISNIRTKETYDLTFEDFKEKMGKDERESILRKAKIRTLSNRR